MGCDIHFFVEYKVDDHEWQADPHHVYCDEDERVKQVSAVGRNYALFADLAGIRGEGPSPLGLPTDVTTTIKEELDDCDYHSQSWISLKDFKKLIKKHKFPSSKSKDAFYNYDDYDYKKNPHPPDYTTLINYCEDMENNIDWIVFDKHVLNNKKKKYKIDIRLIFGFDS